MSYQATKDLLDGIPKPRFEVLSYVGEERKLKSSRRDVSLSTALDVAKRLLERPGEPVEVVIRTLPAAGKKT